MSDRVVPQNLEAEQALLGAILVNNEAFYQVEGFLEPAHFTEQLHGRVFELCASLIRAGRAANPVTLKTLLPADLDVGGLTASQYLARLAAEATGVILANEYGRTIRDHALRRSLIVIGEDIIRAACDLEVDCAPQDQIEDAERRLCQLAETGTYEGGFHPFATAVTAAMEMAANAYQREEGLCGLATGFRDLDHFMGGLQPSDQIVLAGRPGMGKTSLATNIAYNVAKQGGMVGFFSLEMSREQLATRIIAERAGMPSHRIRRGKFAAAEFDRLATVAREIGGLPLHIDESGGLTIAQLMARARRLKRQRGLALVVVDYLQLLSGTRPREMNRVQEVTEITTNLKALAKEINVPVLTLSQLSRQVEQREDKRPTLPDLRDSGSIEQDADVVLFVFREEYYLRNREPRAGTEEHIVWTRRLRAAQGTAEVIIAKQRHGPTDTVKLQFDAELTRFADLTDEDRYPERGLAA